MIHVQHRVPRPDLLLGVVRAEGVVPAHSPPGFEGRLRTLLEARRAPLRGDEEAARQAARDVLRNGRYKPTGRGKPASEYLVRAASEGFPRINAPVDVCNYVSLLHLVPISLWDLGRAASTHFVFRLGAPSESYVFNAGGQAIGLEDLVVGCRLTSAGDLPGEPIVNPVKDSLATKTTPGTTRVAACVYAPAAVLPEAALAAVCADFADLLAACGPSARAAHAVVRPGEEGTC